MLSIDGRNNILICLSLNLQELVMNKNFYIYVEKRVYVRK